MTATDRANMKMSGVGTVLADTQVARSYSAGDLVLVRRMDDSRLLFASAAAAAFFEATELDDLRHAIVTRATEGAARLFGPSAQTLHEGAARLERVRVYRTRRPEILDFVCRRIVVAEVGAFFVAMARPNRTVKTYAGARDLRDTAVAPAPVAQPETAALAPIPTGRDRARFVWQTDADARVTQVGAELVEAVGRRNGLTIGDLLPQRLSALGIDPNGEIASALSGDGSWHRFGLPWPVDDGDLTLRVDLAGVPNFDRQRRLTGYRGFGLLHVRRSTARLAPLADSASFSPNGETMPERPIRGSSAVEATPAGALDADDPCRADISDRPMEPARLEDDSIAPTIGHAPAATAPTNIDDIGESIPAPQAQVSDSLRNRQAAAPPRPIETARPDPVPHAPSLPENHMDAADTTARAAFDSIEHHAADEPSSGRSALSSTDHDAFDELARHLQARLRDDMAANESCVDQAGAPAVSPASLHAQNLATVMERLPTGVLVTRGGVALYANRTLLDLLGYCDIDAFHDAGGLDHMLRGRDPLALDDPQGAAVCIVRADGEVLIVDGHLQSVTWDDEPASLISFRRSIEAEVSRRTGSLRIDIEARDREAAELRAVLDTATDGVAVLDEKGRILSLNRAGEALFGLDQTDVVGSRFTVLLVPESHGTAIDYLDGLTKNGVASVLNDGREVLGRAGKGGLIPLFMTIGRLPDGPQPRFCAVLRDLTPWKRAERDLDEARRAAEHASQMKSDFLARVSHEIRTPLNAILGFADLIREERFGPVGNERYREYLRDIHASGSLVLSIVNDLLDLSKIEAGKLELNFASVNANKLVAECVALMQPEANRERVIIRMALAPRLPNIVADDRSLRQMMLNVLSNAVKFNEAGGQVIVSTALTDQGMAVVRVRDTGMGMNEADLEAALQPFRQLPTARKTTGTGLGLPLTKALADANRAKFSIKSKKNEGTLVEIAFPSARVLSE